MSRLIGRLVIRPSSEGWQIVEDGVRIATFTYEGDAELFVLAVQENNL